MLYVLDQFAVVMSNSYLTYQRLLLAVLGVYVDHVCIVHAQFYVSSVLYMWAIFSVVLSVIPTLHLTQSSGHLEKRQRRLTALPDYMYIQLTS
jgi:hypothetical protein